MNPEVAELQGLYGPFAFPELLLQKVWWRREFAVKSSRTADGQMLTLHFPGRWNRLGGPDFRDAQIEWNGVRLRGDVEVHLRAEDWEAHGHSRDPAYATVVLHVVLFPPAQPFTTGWGGRLIPILALLPLLWHDLEEYATDEAIAALLNRAEHRIAAELTPLPPEQLAHLLREQGVRRWNEKVRYARRRIERLGWTEACHQTALEIFGYRANRAAMLRVAGEWPADEWGAARVEPEAVFAALQGSWAVQGARPANHPLRRLRQYARWWQERPGWPLLLRQWAESLPPPKGASGGSIGAMRRALGFPVEWERWRLTVCGGVVPPPRGDNLLSDGFLPLVVAADAVAADLAQLWWWQGYPGSLPDALHRGLRELGWAGTAAFPAATGPAQGLIGWLLERQAREPLSAG